jgi:hypothetical protein
MARRPDFEAALAKLAENWLRRSAQRPLLLQSDLRARGLAHLVRGDLPAAIREYEIALERGGPLDELLREELRVLRERAAAAN